MRWLLILIPALAWAQTPGTITESQTKTLAITVGTLTCTVTNQTPATTGVVVACKASSGLSHTVTVPIAAGPNPVVGAIALGNDFNLVYQFTLTAANAAIAYEVTANGTNKKGNL